MPRPMKLSPAAERIAPATPDGGLHDDGGEAVGKQMLHGNAEIAGTNRARRLPQIRCL